MPVINDFLRILLLQRLPIQFFTVLTTTNDNLNNMAIMADKISDVTGQKHGTM